MAIEWEKKTFSLCRRAIGDTSGRYRKRQETLARRGRFRVLELGFQPFPHPIERVPSLGWPPLRLCQVVNILEKRNVERPDGVGHRETDIAQDWTKSRHQTLSF
ncbi:hypothetical protein RUM44_009344 [Polyplax serrata]|uniref:Uncharacterized protein n=1 Tax=Polyplax serrata TaxID=468196 RepID=A0ABR1AU50_POLSC